MIFHWPQWTMIGLMIGGLCIEAHRHDKKREVTGNFWTTLIATIISTTILYFGGFFK